MTSPSTQDPPVKKNAFVHKLYSMLSNSELSHLIWWTGTPEKNTFSLYPCKEFAAALSEYFKHGNVASFVRQLHMYGFHKVSDPLSASLSGRLSQIWEFRHLSGKFKKDDIGSLVHIKRRLQSNNHRNSMLENSRSAPKSQAPFPGAHTLPPGTPSAPALSPHFRSWAPEGYPNDSRAVYQHVYPYPRGYAQISPSHAIQPSGAPLSHGAPQHGPHAYLPPLSDFPYQGPPHAVYGAVPLPAHYAQQTPYYIAYPPNAQGSHGPVWQGNNSVPVYYLNNGQLHLSPANQLSPKPPGAKSESRTDESEPPEFRKPFDTVPQRPAFEQTAAPEAVQLPPLRSASVQSAPKQQSPTQKPADFAQSPRLPPGNLPALYHSRTSSPKTPLAAPQRTISGAAVSKSVLDRIRPSLIELHCGSSGNIRDSGSIDSHASSVFSTASSISSQVTHRTLSFGSISHLVLPSGPTSVGPCDEVPQAKSLPPVQANTLAADPIKEESSSVPSASNSEAERSRNTTPKPQTRVEYLLD